MAKATWEYIVNEVNTVAGTMSVTGIRTDPDVLVQPPPQPEVRRYQQKIATDTAPDVIVKAFDTMYNVAKADETAKAALVADLPKRLADAKAAIEANP